MIAATLLNSIPSSHRDPLIAALREICRNYVERRWEPSELNGGKLCEVVYSILDGVITGKFAATASMPAKLKMVDACRALEQRPADPSRVGDKSLRVYIPRMLIAIYDIRNNRGVGHVGGDVDPNFMDATLVHTMARWVVAELIRTFHGVSTDEAQAVVDTLIERKVPIVWERDGIRRVLDTTMPVRDQVMLLSYGSTDWVPVADLLRWTEYSHPSKFRFDVLSGLHKQRLIEFDARKGLVCLTSKGTEYVETRLLDSQPAAA